MKMIFSPTCFSLLYFILVAVRTSAAAVASPSPSPSPVPKSEYFLKTHLNGGSVFASPVRTPSGLWVVGWSTTKESATSVTFDGQGHLKFNTPTPLFFSFDNSTITPAVLFVTLVPGGDILTGLGLDGDRLAWSGGTQTKEGWMNCFMDDHQYHLFFFDSVWLSPPPSCIRSVVTAKPVKEKYRLKRGWKF